MRARTTRRSVIADTGDFYGSADVRQRVLDAWTASPERFREDANAEEDHALGGYRDRVVIELAQNAADAAVRAGVPGRLRLTLSPGDGGALPAGDESSPYDAREPSPDGDGVTWSYGVLRAANTGAPLTAEGVVSLSTLRASAKRLEQGTVGRFGVGFAAVVSVSDEPQIVASDGSGVGWSVPFTRRVVGEIPELAKELQLREGAVPALRLPFSLDNPEPPPPGFDTVVRLPLRDAAALESVRRQLDQLGPALLLALPGLHTVEVDDRVLTAEWSEDEVIIDGTRWLTAHKNGALDPELLADRPTEERYRPQWSVKWALPADFRLPDDVRQVIHAPTPSDEPLELPALLLASFPLAPDRRHVADGPLTDFLIERAAEAYVDLLRRLGTTPRLLDLVPGPLAAGALDARIRRAILARLAQLPVHGSVVVDGPSALLEPLSEIIPRLLPAGWPARHSALEALGIRRIELADVVDALAGTERDPSWWQALYEALAPADSDSLGALPVPLADGRTVRGPRGLLISDSPDAEWLAGLGRVLGLRFVHPDAAHPLLLKLGALQADPRAVLADPALRGAVEESLESDDPGEIGEAVLGLVAAAGLRPGEEPWLAELALRGDDGEIYPAGELLLPDAPLAEVVAEDAPFGEVDHDLVEHFGADVLRAVGVLDTFALVTVPEISVGDVEAGLYHLEGEEDWVADILDRVPEQDFPPMIAELNAVRDLELVADWPAALELLAQPPLRAAITEPAYLLLADGSRVAVPSYTAWWLSGQPVVEGLRPAELCAAGAEPLLAELYDPAPETLERDPELARALGVRMRLEDLLSEPYGAAELLGRLADPEREVSRATLRALLIALAEIDSPLQPPERVRAVVDGAVEVVAASDSLVLDRPDLLPLLTGQPLVIASYDLAGRLADLLDLSLASEEFPGVVESSGSEVATPELLLGLFPDAPETLVEHESLVVDGRTVPWWQEASGRLHVTADPGAVARAVAWGSGRWGDRLLAEAALRDPGSLPRLLAESELDLH